MVYYHDLTGRYHNITLCPVRVLTCRATYWSTAKGGNWDDEITVKWLSPFNTASNILLGLTACLSFGCIPFISVFVKSKP